MNQIISHRTTALAVSTIPPMSRELDRALSVARNGLYGDQILRTHALTAERRAELQERVSALQSLIAPAQPREIAGAISKLFRVLASRGDTAEGARDRVAAYVEVIGSLPLWAIEKAVSAFLQGRAGDGTWVPTAVELFKVGSSYILATQEQINRIQEVLSAKVVDEVDRNPEIRAEKRAQALSAIRSQWGIGEPIE